MRELKWEDFGTRNAGFGIFKRFSGICNGSGLFGDGESLSPETGDRMRDLSYENFWTFSLSQIRHAFLVASSGDISDDKASFWGDMYSNLRDSRRG